MSIWLARLKNRRNPIPQRWTWYGRIDIAAYSGSAVIFKAPPADAILEITGTCNGSKALSSSSDSVLELIVDPVWSNQYFGGLPDTNILELIAENILDKALINILDEGTEVLKTNTLNFIGADVLAAEYQNRANIQIPPLSYAPFYNQGLGEVPDISTYSRLVSNPGPFLLGSYSAGQSAPCIRNGNIKSYTTDNPISIHDLTTKISIKIGISEIFKTGIIKENKINTNLVFTIAVGRNDYGQLNVSSWTNIIAIAGGFYHSLGLNYDGTVVGVGGNNYGQLNVSSWTNIIAIAGGFYNSLGLKSDGTAVGVGSNYYGQTDVSSWENIIAIAGGGYHSLGLKSDGTVVALGSNNYGQLNVSSWENIIAIAGGGYHSLGLKSDGTVVAVGRLDYGQIDVSSWTNITNIAGGIYHSLGLSIEYVKVIVSDFESDYDKYKANITVELKSAIILAYGGEFDLTITHENSVAGNFIKNQKCFRDSESYIYSISTPTISEHTLGSSKYLSGVRFYSKDDIFSVSISDIDYPNSNSYIQPFLKGSFTDYGIQDIHAGSDHITGWTNDYDASNLSYTSPIAADGEPYLVVPIVNVANYFSMSATAKCSFNPIDWEELSAVDSTNDSILVNTYPDVSTAVYEGFQDEIWRLPVASYDSPLGTTETSWKNQWTSSTDLGSGDLQCWFDSNWTLYYPRLDYSTYKPNAASQPDYSSATGRRYYYRAFYNNTSNSVQGSIRLIGLAKTDLDIATGSGLRVEFKIPGKTGWLDLGTDFNYSTYSGSTGDGIWQNKSNQDNDWFDFGWTFEDALDSSCGWVIVVRISAENISTTMPTNIVMQFDDQEHA